MNARGHDTGAGDGAAGPGASPPAAPTRRRRRGCLSRLLALLVVAALLEVAVRVALTLPPWHRPLLGAPRHVFYPELQQAEVPPAAGEQAVLEVLLLGGSVLDPAWSDAAARLAARLQQALGPRELRVLNLARAGHTTLDSFYKLRHLQDRRFDALVVYHGINDVRANNCPPELFQRDYAQYLWYRTQTTLEPPPGQSFARASRQPFVLPVGAAFASLSVANWAGWLRCVPPGQPSEEWLQYGATILTQQTFAANLTGIGELARAAGTPLVLPVFATFVPPDYSLQAFQDGALPYARNGQPLELWGRAENVLAGLAVHEQVLRAHAERDGNATLVETASLRDLGGLAFRDACHLTPRGADALAALLQPVLVEALR